MTDIPRETFMGETPEVTDVVLCLHCGETLHDVEHDVFWEDTYDHPLSCVPHLLKRLRERD